jgi:membrane associated rhomboid family serine protease
MLSITLTIIIITVLISIAALGNSKIKEDLIFWPAAMKGRQLHRFITHGFIHGDYIHLAFNMFTLWSFGRNVEYWFMDKFEGKGKLLYILFYLLGIIVASMPDYFKYKDQYGYRSLGASGGVCAVIFASILFYPMDKLYPMFLPIGIPGIIIGPLFLIISVYLARRGGGNIGHSAHITGAIFGLIFVIIVAKLVANYDVIQAFMRQLQQGI